MKATSETLVRITGIYIVLDAPAAEGGSLKNKARANLGKPGVRLFRERHCPLLSSLLLQSMADLDAEIAALRTAVNARSDAELADLLGIGRSAISQWRKRGVIPARARMQAEEVRAHLAHYADARRKLASLPVELETNARALAIAFAYRHAHGEGRRAEDWLARWASSFDQLVMAAALLIAEERLGPELALAVLLGSDRLERMMLDALLPPALDRKLPQ